MNSELSSPLPIPPGESGAEDELAALVEEIGLLMEESGYTRMVGRTLGQMMLSEKPLHSQAELAQVLHASVASISGALRVLGQRGYVERVPVRGSRRDYYRLLPHRWPGAMDRSLLVVTRYREVAERALQLLPDRQYPSREAIEEMREYMTFIEREIPALIEKYTEARRTQSEETKE